MIPINIDLKLLTMYQRTVMCTTRDEYFHRLTTGGRTHIVAIVSTQVLQDYSTHPKVT